MELLKKILRQSLALGVTRMRLAVGQRPELSNAKGALASEHAQPLTDAEIQQMFLFLFPNEREALAGRQAARGLLTVPGVGRIHIMMNPLAPASLWLFPPPDGQALCDAEWARMSAAKGQGTAAGPVNGIAMAPTPQISAAAPLGGEALQAAGSTLGGFVPSGLDAGPELMAVSAPSPKATAGGPHAVAAASPQPGDDRFQNAFVPVHPQKNAVKAAPAPVDSFLDSVNAMPSPFVPDFSASLAQAAANPKGTMPSPQNEESLVLDFGPDQGGMASKSRGENPIDAVLTDMVQRHASDLHMTCNEALRLRLDGDIVVVGDRPVSVREMEGYLLPIMPERNRAEFAKINDTDFAYEIEGVGRFRVNVFRDRNGVGAVMRHIPSKILTAEQLGLPPAITKLCTLSKGLVLVTGPTGSGKSTTLAAMIDWINKTRSDHILTIEDPIEFIHPQQRCLVNQREVHKHTGSFARALKAALREDPDIVLIGEMRDLETIAIAIETAETGHLVFGTLHTSTAVSTVDRIIDQFPSDRQEQIRTMLSSSLKGVVAQTLLKKKGGGRIAAHEILITADAVSAMIREGKNHMIPNHMQSQKADGNQMLNEVLAKLVQSGIVDAEEAMRKAVEKLGLSEALQRMGIKLPQPLASVAKSA